MSIKGLNPHPDTLFNKTFHHRHDSDEIDVFQASRYFSGEPTTLAQKLMMRDENPNNGDFWNRISRGGGGQRRMSLDMPTMRNCHHHSLFSDSQHHHHHTVADQNQILKEKKHKQPSSPGGRLASFLNSLFSQSASKKKKPKSTHDQDPGDSPGGGRRKRRSSISHFSTNPNHSTTIYSVSSKNSALRTSETPNKTAYWSVSGHKETVAPSLPNKNIILNGKKDPDSSEKVRTRDERSSYSTINKYSHSGRDKPVFDDGAGSDSSSDLFELQSYDLGDYSSGLPVYETTHMDSIKRGVPVSVYAP